MVSMSLTNTILHTFDSPQFDMHGVQYKSNLNHQLFLSLRTRPSIPQASLTYWSLQVQILFPPHIYFFTFSQHNFEWFITFLFFTLPLFKINFTIEYPIHKIFPVFAQDILIIFLSTLQLHIFSFKFATLFE